MSAESPDTKYIVPIKGVEKIIKLDDKAKSELQAIGMMDEKGKVAYWNPSAERIFGYTISEISGKDVHMVLCPSKYYEKYAVQLVTSCC